MAKVRNAGTEQDLGIQYKALKPEVDKLNMMAAKRQQVRVLDSLVSSGGVACHHSTQRCEHIHGMVAHPFVFSTSTANVNQFRHSSDVENSILPAIVTPPPVTKTGSNMGY